MRTICKWCRNNRVRVLFDCGSKWRFVLREELEKAMNRAHQETGRKVLRKKRRINDIYVPQGQYEKEVLSIFTNI